MNLQCRTISTLCLRIHLPETDGVLYIILHMVKAEYLNIIFITILQYPPLKKKFFFLQKKYIYSLLFNLYLT